MRTIRSKRPMAATLTGVLLALHAAPALAQATDGRPIQNQAAAVQPAWFHIGKQVGHEEQVGTIEFDNEGDSMSGYGLRITSGTNTDSGYQVALRAETAVDNYAGQSGWAGVSLATTGGYHTHARLRAVLGDVVPEELDNVNATQSSTAVGGWFRSGPESGTSLVLGDGGFHVGGVYGEVHGDIVGGDSTGKIVAGVIGIDSTAAAGSGTSFAGYFDGDVLSTTGVFTSSSRRFKEDVAPMEGGLDAVLALQGVTYTSTHDDAPSLGLIAEEVGEVLPELVRYDRDGEHAVGVDYARLSAVLVEGVKTQQAMIDELRRELDELRGQIADGGAK